MITERIPPQNNDAEMYVLGCIFLDESIIPMVLESLKPSYFYHERHQAIFATISGLYKKKRPVDIVSVRDALRKNKKLSVSGGSAYLSSVLGFVSTSLNWNYYASIIKDTYQRRELIKVAMKVADDAYEDEVETPDMLAKFQEEITAISAETITGGQLIHLGEIVDEAFQGIEKQLDGDSRIIGLPSGISTLDTLLRGFIPGDLIIIAGRTGQGKSSLASTIALHIGETLKQPVAFFSMEMNKVQVARRFICAHAKVNQRAIQEGYYKEKQSALIRSVDLLRESNIFLDQSMSLSLSRLNAKLLVMKYKHGLKAVFVDYLQLMNSEVKGNRQEQIASITRGLKVLAGEFDVPVVCLSQLKRLGTGEKEREPELYDLRESGAIEQDAAVVVFIHDNWLLVKKQRDGVVGRVKVKFNYEYTLFEDAYEWEEEGRRDIDG